MSHRPYLTTLALVAVVLSGCLTDGRFILRGPGLPVANGPSANPVPGAVTPPTTPLPPDTTGSQALTVRGTAVLNGTPLSSAAVSVFRVADAQTLVNGVVTDGQGGFAAVMPAGMEPGTVLLILAHKGDVTLSQTYVTGASLATQAEAMPAIAAPRLDLASTIVTKRLLPKVAEAILTMPAGSTGRPRLTALLTRMGSVIAAVTAQLTGPVRDERLGAAIVAAGAQPDGAALDALSQAMVAYGDASPFIDVVEATHQAWLDNLEDGGPPVGPRPWQIGPVRVDLPGLQAKGDTQVLIDHQGRSVLVPSPLWRFRDVPPVIAWLERLLGNGASPAIGGGGTSGGGGAAPVPTPTPLVGIDTGVTIVDGDPAATPQAGKLVKLVAGSVGSENLAPEAGAATTVNLKGPMGLAMDSKGNLYIASQYHRRVKRVNASDGQMVTVAGSGAGAASNGQVTACLGNNAFCSFLFGAASNATGPATAAVLGSPNGLAIDAADNLYIADTVWHCVRKVDATGTITTVAGLPGTPGNAGDGLVATSARLKGPGGLAVDSGGNLYIADSLNHCVRKVAAGTGIFSTVLGTAGTAGSGANQLYTPTGLAVDRQDNLYIADSQNFRIRRVDAGTGAVTTYAGTGTTGAWGGVNGDGGAATSATLYQPSGLAFDRQGNLYIAGTGDNLNPNVIRKVDAGTGIITTVVGRWTLGATTNVTPLQLDAGNPAAVMVDPLGALYFSDRVKAIVQVVR
jgi:sugar lactone lactonase YvrE